MLKLSRLGGESLGLNGSDSAKNLETDPKNSITQLKQKQP